MKQIRLSENTIHRFCRGSSSNHDHETLVKMKEVSVDVLARNSSYSVWVERLSEFKIKKGNMVADDAMEF